MAYQKIMLIKLITINKMLQIILIKKIKKIKNKLMRMPEKGRNKLEFTLKESIENQIKK